MPRLSPAQAAALSAAFLRDVTGNVQAASSDGSVAGFVAYAPAGAAALFDGMLAPGTGLLLADGNIDCPPGVRGFGRCLLHAVQTLLADGQQSVCVLNADSPNLPTAYLRQAALALAAPGNRVVLGPAEDGGYYLLGMKQAHACLFSNIDWSTDRVADQTRARAKCAGIDLVELDPWYDVDEPDMLARLIHDLANAGPGPAFPAPHSAARLETYGLLTRTFALAGTAA